MITALVCAHSQSEGLPDKSLRTLGGRTLLEIAVQKALDCGLVDRVALFTDYPSTFRDGLHPPHFTHIRRDLDVSGPRIPKWELWRHAVERMETKPDAIVDIDVTRPLTTSEDVAGTIELWKGLRAPFPAAAFWPGQRRPACDLFFSDNRRDCFRSYADAPAVNRHDVAECWGYGGIFVAATEWLFADRVTLWPSTGTAGREIPRAHGFDIDDELDWQIVQDQWARQNSATTWCIP